MTLRDIPSRYAILENLTDRTVKLYNHTLDRFAEHLGRAPTLDDIGDLGRLAWSMARPQPFPSG